MFGAKLTLIVLSSQRLARIDLAGPRRRLYVDRVFSCPANASAELAASVAIAYRLGEPTDFDRKASSVVSRAKRSVIVLSDDIWNDSIKLPLDVTVLLQPAELQQALAIEASNYSGINAFGSQFVTKKIVDTSSKILDASSNCPQEDSWWIAQASAGDLANMNTAADACGFKLLGTTHTRAYEHSVLEQSFLSADLRDDTAGHDFGMRWANVLSKDGLDLLIRTDSAASRTRGASWIQTSAAVVTALVCAGIYHSRSSELDFTQRQQAQLQQVLSEYDAMVVRLRTAQAQSKKLRQEASGSAGNRPQPVSVRQPDASLDNNGSKWVAIFESLATQAPDDCWIESWHSAVNEKIEQDSTLISANSAGITLTGRAVTAQAIHQLASRLEQSLNGQGWQVQTPSIRQEENSLLSYELSILPHSKSGDWQ